MVALTRFDVMKRLIPVLILLAAAIAAGVYFYPRLTSKTAPANQLTLSGNIEAHESLVSFKVAGRITELPVEEGQQVEQGALLAQLEDADYKQRVRMDEAGVRVRESDLALTLAGTREQEVKAAQQAMIDALADLEQKKLDSDRAQRLFAKDEVTAQERDLAATAVKRAEAIFKAAQQRYNEAVEGSRKEEIAIARANLNQASANLGLSQVNLDYTILRAPSAGVITVRQAELGEVVAPGSPVVTLADLDHIWLRAYIAETDLGRIHWGQEATVTTDTYPGKQYNGRISFISSNAEFTPKSVQTNKERVTLVYRIKIDIDNLNHELKPGMPADAHIVLAAAGPEAQPTKK
jgi:HlyD family secretion protein